MLSNAPEVMKTEDQKSTVGAHHGSQDAHSWDRPFLLTGHVIKRTPGTEIKDILGLKLKVLMSRISR